MKETERLLRAVKKAGGVILEQGDDGLACQLPRSNYNLCIIVSWGMGWDHVSIHAVWQNDKQFIPFWEDMCYAKYLFFKPSETVVQYHPPKSVYKNYHEYTLHLWRPQNKEIELPPINMV